MTEREHDRVAERLSEYLDGELGGRERAEVERHLAACAECRDALAELREVVAEARALATAPARRDVAPAVDLWPAIEARLAPSGRNASTLDWRQRLMAARIALSLPQLAAAAALLIVATAGGAWLVLRGGPTVTPGTALVPGAVASRQSAQNPVTTEPAQPGATDSNAAGPARVTSASDANPASSGAADAAVAGYDLARYDAAITQLQDVVHAHRAELDTATVRVIEQNLALIDRAIADARHALATDPANPYLNGHLAQQLQRKVRLLQQATDLVAVRE